MDRGVHLPIVRSVTIAMISCDLEVIYSFGLSGVATVLKPSGVKLNIRFLRNRFSLRIAMAFTNSRMVSRRAPIICYNHQRS